MPAKTAPAPAKQTADHQRQLANLRRRLRRLQREEDDIRQAVGDTLYTFTMRLVQSGKFPAVVRVTEDGYCGGCHVKLPPQTLADLRYGSLTECDSCSRILYDPQDGKS